MTARRIACIRLPDPAPALEGDARAALAGALLSAAPRVISTVAVVPVPTTA